MRRVPTVCMRPRDQTVAQVLAKIAEEAHGVVTRGELLRAGVSRAVIKQRAKKGELLREHRGVYRVGHRAPCVEATYLAAVRACGDGALLSGMAAARHLGLLRGAVTPPEVVTPTERRVAGVRTRRSRCIDPRDATVWNRIPVTSVARTLVDLAGVLGVDDLARACHEAGVRHGTTPADVRAVIERRPMSAGAGRLRRILDGDVHVTLSKLEARFLARLRQVNLALPETNRPADGRRVDCRWPDQHLRSSSTAIAITALATPGNRTDAASARHTPVVTTSADTPTVTFSMSQVRCSTSCATSSRGVIQAPHDEPSRRRGRTSVLTPSRPAPGRQSDPKAGQPPPDRHNPS